MKRLLVVCMSSFVLLGCGGENSEPAAQDVLPPVSTTTTTRATTTTATPTTATPTTSAPTTTAAPTTTEVEVADEPPADPVPADLVGRWAHYDVVAYEDGDFKTLIVSYGFNDFTEEDGVIIDAASFCFSDQVTNQPITTSMSDAATQAIQPPTTPLGVEVANGVLTIRRDPTPTPVGIRLEDPANESLPTNPDDPRIVDDDGDGNPGLTVTIDVGGGITGELYIARREIFSYDAVLTSADLIEGSVTDASEQLAIGASNPLFLQSADWVQVPDPERNPIILTRVDETWDCDRLAAERDALFPPTPTADW